MLRSQEFPDTLCDKDCKPLTAMQVYERQDKMTARNSGKTFRKVLKALGYASSGKKVYYIYDQRHVEAYILRMMEDYLHRIKDVNVNFRNRRIEFAGAGSIQLVEKERFNHDREHLLCSYANTKVIEDLD